MPIYLSCLRQASIAIFSWLAGILLLLCQSYKWTRWAGVVLVGVSLLVAPFTWSALTTFNPNPDVALPTAGVDGMSATTFMTPNQELLGVRGAAILDYVTANTDPDSYLLAVNTARGAAPYILETGRKVFTFGGFTGTDDIVDLDGFIRMLRCGEIRFVLGLPQQKPEIARYIQRSCTTVDLPDMKPQGQNQANSLRNEQNEELFDCGL